MRKIVTLFIHCTATANLKRCPAARIHGWHKKRGWDGIGYNAVIQPDGSLEPGRPDYWVPSQAKGHNAVSLGVTMAGTDKFTPAAWARLLRYCSDKVDLYPGLQIRGHNEVNPNKTCPGFDVQKWVKSYGLPGKA